MIDGHGATGREPSPRPAGRSTRVPCWIAHLHPPRANRAIDDPAATRGGRRQAAPYQPRARRSGPPSNPPGNPPRAAPCRHVRTCTGISRGLGWPTSSLCVPLAPFSLLGLCKRRTQSAVQPWAVRSVEGATSARLRAAVGWTSAQSAAGWPQGAHARARQAMASHGPGFIAFCTLFVVPCAMEEPACSRCRFKAS